MLEISDLKTKRLPELQSIAKQLKMKRITGLKKDGFDLSNFRLPGC